ncbi:MAG TPA: plastocyanin/azurin family copper-binding protein [Thermoanaerobaculia bacterium]|jgi:plastocyanin
MRKTLLAVLFVSVAACLHAEEVTLPAVASVVGLNPFFSDVRVFNTSYSAALNVTATYHCFIACPAGPAPQIAIALAPRQSKAYDDMIAQAFLSPGTAGGVEFEFSGVEGQLVVTSRLYSTTPVPTVGMFIAGVESSKAHTTSVITSVRNGGANGGFRTNAGFYNPNDAGASVTLQIFDGGAAIGTAVTQSVGGHSGAQVNNIFGVAGVGSTSTENAFIVATSATPILAYAAVIDNNTTDPIFVAGSADPPAQASAPQTRVVHVGRGGTNFVDDVSGNGVTTINVGDTVKWVWEGDLHHGSDAGTCTSGGGNPYGGVHPEGYAGCTSDGTWVSGTQIAPFSYSHTFTQSGTFKYFCDVHMSAMTGRVVVNPAPAGASAQAAELLQKRSKKR